jgi:hypothetical protein
MIVAQAPHDEVTAGRHMAFRTGRWRRFSKTSLFSKATSGGRTKMHEEF